MRKKVFALTAVLILSQCLMACGSTGRSYDGTEAAAVAEESVNYASDEMYSQTEDSVENGEGSDTQVVQTERKLIRTVYLNVETKEYDTLLVNLDKKIQDMGGYVEDMSAYNGSMEASSSQGRSASFTVRIPSASLDDFLTQVGEVVNIVERKESVEDVTLQYVDMDSHVRMLKEEQDRLMEFLSQVTTIEEIITIEQRLSEVKYQLESMSSQLRTMDNQVDYATVNIDISEVVELTPVGELTVGERIATGFAGNVEHVKDGLTEFFIWFVTSIPYLLIWAIVAAIIFAIVCVARKISKKNALRYEERRKQRVQNATVPRPVKPVQKGNEEKDGE